MTASDPKPRRFFLCTGQCVAYGDLFKYPRSHILGELVYMTDEGRRVTAFALWDVPVPADEVPPLRPLVRTYQIGDARRIPCVYPGCENSQRWEIGRAGILALMDRMGLQDEFLEKEGEGV